MHITCLFGGYVDELTHLRAFHAFQQLFYFEYFLLAFFAVP